MDDRPNQGPNEGVDSHPKSRPFVRGPFELRMLARMAEEARRNTLQPSSAATPAAPAEAEQFASTWGADDPPEDEYMYMPSSQLQVVQRSQALDPRDPRSWPNVQKQLVQLLMEWPSMADVQTLAVYDKLREYAQFRPFLSVQLVRETVEAVESIRRRQSEKQSSEKDDIQKNQTGNFYSKNNTAAPAAAPLSSKDSYFAAEQPQAGRCVGTSPTPPPSDSLPLKKYTYAEALKHALEDLKSPSQAQAGGLYISPPQSQQSVYPPKTGIRNAAPGQQPQREQLEPSIHQRSSQSQNRHEQQQPKKKNKPNAQRRRAMRAIKEEREAKEQAQKAKNLAVRSEELQEIRMSKREWREAQAALAAVEAAEREEAEARWLEAAKKHAYECALAESLAISRAKVASRATAHAEDVARALAQEEAEARAFAQAESEARALARRGDNGARQSLVVFDDGVRDDALELRVNFEESDDGFDTNHLLIDFNESDDDADGGADDYDQYLVDLADEPLLLFD